MKIKDYLSRAREGLNNKAEDLFGETATKNVDDIAKAGGLGTLLLISGCNSLPKNKTLKNRTYKIETNRVGQEDLIFMNYGDFTMPGKDSVKIGNEEMPLTDLSNLVDYIALSKDNRKITLKQDGVKITSDNPYVLLPICKQNGKYELNTEDYPTMTDLVIGPTGKNRNIEIKDGEVNITHDYQLRTMEIGDDNYFIIQMAENEDLGDLTDFVENPYFFVKSEDSEFRTEINGDKRIDFLNGETYVIARPEYKSKAGTKGKSKSSGGTQ